MSRRNDGILLKFLMDFVDAPLWVAPLGAAAVYFTMAVLPGLLPQDPHKPVLLVVTTMMRTWAPYVAGLVLAFGVFGALKRAFNRGGPAGATQIAPGGAMATAPASLCTPACPRCGSPTVERVVRKGASAGKAFWGCQTYPRCKGTVG